MPCQHVKFAKEHSQANIKEPNAFKGQTCMTQSVVTTAQVIVQGMTANESLH